MQQVLFVVNVVLKLHIVSVVQTSSLIFDTSFFILYRAHDACRSSARIRAWRWRRRCRTPPGCTHPTQSCMSWCVRVSVSVSVSVWVYVRACGCQGVRVRACVCVWVSVCVWNEERGRERQSEREQDIQTQDVICLTQDLWHKDIDIWHLWGNKTYRRNTYKRTCSLEREHDIKTHLTFHELEEHKRKTIMDFANIAIMCTKW